MNSTKRFFSILFISALLVLGGRIVYSADVEKVGTVNISKVFDEYQKTKDYDVEFQRQGRSKQEDRDKLVHDVRRLRDEEALLAGDVRDQKKEAIESKLKELDTFDSEARNDLEKKRNTAVREVFQDIENTLQQYGERKGFDVIYNDRALLYRKGKLDVTSDVLKELNDHYRKQKK